MDGASVQQMADRVAELMSNRLGIRGRTLADKLRRGGRRLPRRVRKQAEYLSRAVDEAANPALLARMDQERVAAAFDACLRHLQPIGAGQRWYNRLMDFAAQLAFVILVTGLLVLATLVWRGYL
ncbi:hypothetical protein OEW28_06985 [Defluviimonas sp. WL0002]|uniref:Uncharacterized protein n=1 Tax=Albidovulum marisflavi TaxID=2984159 RepID=A0ABT2ZBA1_9RHOB|nr:hypothetical protein [Defluviimonas sp. WL0002]MCV2868371.1 hypothetical protein [Defluviimonas sp. WL0002]